MKFTIYRLKININKSFMLGLRPLSYLSILSVPDEGYSRNVLCALNLISTFYYHHWVDASAGGLLIPEGIIRPVVSASALTWFIRYMCY
jgi:hypothetical protein